MSGHESSYTPTNAFTRWLDTRLPIIRFAQDTAINFPTPKNLNYWWTFGGILAVCLATQIITGVILAMHYEASVDGAFASVERIMRDVPYGWLLRYIHANGASMFFLAVYIHMFRGLYYGSYKAPREVLWILGCVIYLLMMATAFLGYMLPWGQMSYHGSNVITGLFGAIPLIGESIQTWLMGGPSIGNQTLQRFFSLHYLLPFMIAAVVILHVWALHVPGNNNPTGVEVQDVEKETVPFHPYYTVKDAFAIVIFLLMFAVFVFYAPNVLGHADNYVEANPLVTPSHIVPEWYLLPFYAILRAITFDLGPIPAKLLGVIFMFAAIAVLFLLPWLDTSKVKSMRYRPVAKQFFFGFVVVCLLLGWCGAANPDDAVIPALQGDPKLVVSYTENAVEVTSEYKGGGEAYHDAKSFMETLPAGSNPSLSAVPAPTFQFRHLSLILTFCYFGYFVILFFIGLTEKPKEVPESIHKSVLKRHKASTATAIPAE
ncbi:MULTISPECIES: cytochrome b N-terminal domain-containing protein [unclassified Hyphomonas]|jgi:ubiquinol-cytochrome c reductase cytochrome b subunit|uniref:cytochrome b n=1 Tax=unclassified Hyphomonas TaxID=2630699 RepID=UPI000458CAC8|nr:MULTISPECIES: cytochrome b N-terminal domain-containing protein [unclassified Hyphomonas]KCZ45355.1 ubiquinol cytochrome C oxidoreductase [Hyphomonas sp. CY54-11-8]RAN41684.1 ubiquinol cytochrome C oxidoreductase [Hyphomonas sp. GM-8P]